ncbi:MAG TPA: LysR substrate-binding domain-containing protein [Streptosporangiaceae bacterium]|nr:LysR substrate-binding domain-containing protein [Streptosporangiaceae bacterium]
MDLDLRKVRYFVAVAEEENFGRAAEALHIAQPVLSRQIRALEQDLKVRLFERDTRGTLLTAAGRALLEDARTLLPAAAAAQRRARDAAGQRTFTVGFAPGVIITPAVREFSRRHPDVAVEVFRSDWMRQGEIVRDGQVDVGYLRLPADVRGLAVEPLFTEPRVVMLPADHQLAGKEAVSVTDLASEHLLQNPDDVPEWRDIALELRDRAPRRRIPRLRTVEEKLEHVAAGSGVAVLPQSAATAYSRPDIVLVPVSDLAPSQVCLAWDNSRDNALIREYVAIALGS